jgi:hypothetical protein
MLNFSLSGPTCFTFLQYYLTCLKSVDDDYQCLRMLSNYFCTLTLLHDRPFSSYRPSIIAAACLFIASRLLVRHPISNDAIWQHRYVQVTGYSQCDLNECTLALAELHAKSFEQDKTTSSLLRRYCKISKDDESYRERVREIIHQSKFDDHDENDDDDDDDDDDGHADVLDLTLDEFDEHQMSMDHYR